MKIEIRVETTSEEKLIQLIEIEYEIGERYEAEKLLKKDGYKKIKTLIGKITGVKDYEDNKL